jgi:hypothetical protein
MTVADADSNSTPRIVHVDVDVDDDDADNKSVTSEMTAMSILSGRSKQSTASSKTTGASSTASSVLKSRFGGGGSTKSTSKSTKSTSTKSSKNKVSFKIVTSFIGGAGSNKKDKSGSTNNSNDTTIPEEEVEISNDESTATTTVTATVPVMPWNPALAALMAMSKNTSTIASSPAAVSLQKSKKATASLVKQPKADTKKSQTKSPSTQAKKSFTQPPVAASADLDAFSNPLPVLPPKAEVAVAVAPELEPTPPAAVAVAVEDTGTGEQEQDKENEEPEQDNTDNETETELASAKAIAIEETTKEESVSPAPELAPVVPLENVSSTSTASSVKSASSKKSQTTTAEAITADAAQVSIPEPVTLDEKAGSTLSKETDLGKALPLRKFNSVLSSGGKGGTARSARAIALTPPLVALLAQQEKEVVVEQLEEEQAQEQEQTAAAVNRNHTVEEPVGEVEMSKSGTCIIKKKHKSTTSKETPISLRRFNSVLGGKNAPVVSNADLKPLDDLKEDIAEEEEAKVAKQIEEEEADPVAGVEMRKSGTCIIKKRQKITTKSSKETPIALRKFNSVLGGKNAPVASKESLKPLYDLKEIDIVEGEQVEEAKEAKQPIEEADPVPYVEMRKSGTCIIKKKKKSINKSSSKETPIALRKFNSVLGGKKMPEVKVKKSDLSLSPMADLKEAIVVVEEEAEEVVIAPVAADVVPAAKEEEAPHRSSVALRKSKTAGLLGRNKEDTSSKPASSVTEKNGLKKFTSMIGTNTDANNSLTRSARDETPNAAPVFGSCATKDSDLSIELGNEEAASILSLGDLTHEAETMAKINTKTSLERAIEQKTKDEEEVVAASAAAGATAAAAEAAQSTPVKMKVVKYILRSSSKTVEAPLHPHRKDQ